MNTNHDALREAVSAFRKACIEFGQDGTEETGNAMYAAQRDLLSTISQPMPEAAAQGWIPVDRQMPKSGQIVLALQKWDHSGKLGVIRAAWVAAKTEESSPESDIGEYDEATDTYYDPEGWYEQISHWDEISAAGVSGATIVAWMPLPDVLSASPAAPAQPDPSADIHSCSQFCTRPGCVAQREPQAQGEPIVFAVFRTDDGCGHVDLVPFQSELDVWDGMELTPLHLYREALAQHRAALEKCAAMLEMIHSADNERGFLKAVECH
tara:strand:- start:1054 stop:1851 length:798 start_codon:yes stop_codon:yes gene_type:complete